MFGGISLGGATNNKPTSFLHIIGGYDSKRLRNLSVRASTATVSHTASLTSVYKNLKSALNSQFAYMESALSPCESHRNAKATAVPIVAGAVGMAVPGML